MIGKQVVSAANFMAVSCFPFLGVPDGGGALVRYKGITGSGNKGEIMSLQSCVKLSCLMISQYSICMEIAFHNQELSYKVHV